jgi:hypothetical protein
MILPGTRQLLYLFSALTLLAFFALFVMSSQTNHYFAWTIQPPVTAAFLGAAYAAGFVLVVLSLRSPQWAVVRIPFTTILIFTVVTLIATVLHRDRLHFGSAETVARFAAWFWSAVYVLVPIGMFAMLVRQERRPAVDRDGRLPVPTPLFAALVVHALLLLAVGVALFVSPATASVLWPWPLTPFTARVVAAWVMAFGVGTVLALRTGDLARLEIAAWPYVVLGVLQLVAVARYAAIVRWTSPASWIYLVTLVFMLLSAAEVFRRMHAHSRLQPSLAPGADDATPGR